MRDLFEIAAGSVIGRDHAAFGRNNQDAFCFWSDDTGSAAVVADGCGSARGSELGARLGCRLVAAALRQRLQQAPERPTTGLLEAARLDVLAELDRVVRAMGGDRKRTLAEHFLFTLLGVLVAPMRSTVFAVGDGVFAVNGRTERLASPEDRPAYLGYALLDSPPLPDHELRFSVVGSMPTRELGSLLIATDGAAALLEPSCPAPARTAGPAPALAAALAGLSRFWEDDRHFRNPASLGRELARLNRSVQRVDWDARSVLREPGPLRDDTTLVVLRRRGLARSAPAPRPEADEAAT